MKARPLVAVLVVLVAFALQGRVDCREAAACAVTRNEVMQ